MFKLDDRLKADTFEITDLALCKLLLMNDQTYPWLIAVPRLEGLTEIHHIPADQQSTLHAEIVQISQLVETVFKPDSVNVAALGNVVSQLHIHVVARLKTDPSWPGPIWGQHPAKAYAKDQANETITKIRQAL